MNICNIGHAIIDNTIKPLNLSNVHHVTKTQKNNLVSFHRFSYDNQASVKYFPYHFFIKDLDTRRILVCVRCLYPLLSNSWGGALGTFKLSPRRWHSHLGQSAHHIVQKLANSNKLSCSNESNIELVCDVCP